MEIKDPTNMKRVSVSIYQLTCPYCKKKLQSQYIGQLNQHYKAHIDSCKAKEENGKTTN